MTVMRYVTGYILSLLLSITAYSFVVYGSASPWIVAGLLVLAVIQLAVQLTFFLHIGDEIKPRYKLASFAFMSAVLVIIVAGSLWIMANLDKNMMNMTPGEKTNYMMTQHDKGF